MRLSSGLAALILFTTVLARADSVRIEWEPIEGATAYQLQIRENDKAVTIVETHRDKTSWSGELTPGTYSYRVRAIDARRRPSQWSKLAPLDVHSVRSVVTVTASGALFSSSVTSASLRQNHHFTSDIAPGVSLRWYFKPDAGGRWGLLAATELSSLRFAEQNGVRVPAGGQIYLGATLGFGVRVASGLLATVEGALVQVPLSGTVGGMLTLEKLSARRLRLQLVYDVYESSSPLTLQLVGTAHVFVAGTAPSLALSGGRGGTLGVRLLKPLSSAIQGVAEISYHQDWFSLGEDRSSLSAVFLRLGFDWLTKS